MEMNLNSKRVNGKCLTRGCKNKPKGKLCGSCYTRQWRINNPYEYAYQTLKDNAKRRGKHFDLSFAFFKKWAIRYKYMRGKGRASESLTIDRDDETKGYTADNIKPMKNGDNVRKYLNYDWVTKFASVLTNRKAQDTGMPF